MEILSNVGFAVAMKNADCKVKEIRHDVTKYTNDEDGVKYNNADVDINDQTFYFSDNNTPVRVNYLEEYSDYVFIRYADYRMLLNSNEENTFVLSFSTGLNNEMWINYESLSVSVTYWQSDAPWYDEIDALINSFDLYNQDSISGEPLRCIKSIFEKEGNDLEAWKNEGSNILNENEYLKEVHNWGEIYKYLMLNKGE